MLAGIQWRSIQRQGLAQRWPGDIPDTEEPQRRTPSDRSLRQMAWKIDAFSFSARTDNPRVASVGKAMTADFLATYCKSRSEPIYCEKAILVILSQPSDSRVNGTWKRKEALSR